jgi:xylulokinase
MYLCVSEQELASGCLDWIKDKVLAEKNYKSLDDMAFEVDPGSNGLLFTPWLFGERSPINDPTVRGGFHNINLNHSRSELVRSVMEGVAFNLRWALHYVERLSNTDSKINIVGGGSLLDSWCQILADVLCRKINRIKNPREATARGAAIIALIALGYTNFDDVPRLVTVDRDFKPDDKNKKTYNELFDNFKQIYRSNKKIYRRLNRQG